MVGAWVYKIHNTFYVHWKCNVDMLTSWYHYSQAAQTYSTISKVNSMAKNKNTAVSNAAFLSRYALTAEWKIMTAPKKDHGLMSSWPLQDPVTLLYPQAWKTFLLRGAIPASKAGYHLTDSLKDEWTESSGQTDQK